MKVARSKKAKPPSEHPMETTRLSRRQIRLFLAAAEEPTQNEAAKREGVSGNHMNRACSAVRKCIGDDPFEMRWRKRQLTRAGEVAYAFFSKQLVLLEQFQAELERQTLQVRVEATPTFINVVKQAAEGLSEPYEATVDDGFSADMRKRLIAGQIDVFVGYALCHEEDRHVELNSFELSCSPLCLVVPEHRARIADVRAKLAGLSYCHIDHALYPSFGEAAEPWLRANWPGFGPAGGKRSPRRTGPAVLTAIGLKKHFGILPRSFSAQNPGGVHFDREIKLPGFDFALSAYYRNDDFSDAVRLFLIQLAKVFGVPKPSFPWHDANGASRRTKSRKSPSKKS